MGLNETLDYPSKDTVEVSLFGGGNSYGESLLIHLQNDFWIAIDSCVNPSTRTPLSLDYLKNISPDYKNLIKQIYATHWHDDHIKGLSEILHNSQNCSFFCLSSALQREEFRILTRLHKTLSSNNSGVKEFYSIFEILQNRKEVKAKLSLGDRLLYEKSIGRAEISVYSLTPSDKSVIDSLMYFAHQFEKVKENPNIVFQKQSKNDNSVVLLVNINNISLLLGADLEVTGDQETGWEAVLKSEKMKSIKAGLFKIPHHGSSTAYLPEIWKGLLKENVFACLTPWKLGKRHLPTEENKRIILSHTTNAYITSGFSRIKIKKRQNKVYKITNDFDLQLTDIPYMYGHVRLRNNIVEDKWNVQLFGKDTALNDLSFEEE